MSEAKAGAAVSTYTVIGNVDANGKAQPLSIAPLLVETTPSKVTTPNVYDANDNLLTEVETLPSGTHRTWTRTYDANDNLLTETFVDV